MAPKRAKASTAVKIDPTLPLHATVDFQSRHRAAFRLFTKGPKQTDPWVFLQEGFQDATAITQPLARGSKLKSEFIYFAETYTFRALLTFRQSGQTLDGGTRPVKAAGTDMYVEDTAALE